jgi:hypothetical protein
VTTKKRFNNNNSRLQYKTPNLSGRLLNEEVKQAGYVTRSTQRALSLKKNWVSDAPATVTTGKKSDAAELDNRLKSLMERLSNQQSLLKPADKPSSQMEHILKNLPSARISLSQSSTSLRDPSRFKSPPPLSLTGTSAGPQTSTTMSSYHFYPSLYLTSTTATGTGTATTTTTTASAAVVSSIAGAPIVEKDPVEDSAKGFTEVERLVVPDKKEELKPELTGTDSTSSESTSDSSSESTQSENLSPLPPPIPPAPIMVPDILIHEDHDVKFPEQPPTADQNEAESEVAASINQTNDSGKEEFESCLENQESENKTDDQNFHTPGAILDDSAECSASKEEDIQLDSPLATSSPMTQTPQKEEIVVKVKRILIWRLLNF